jgi:quinol monooxygenase YgiN
MDEFVELVSGVIDQMRLEPTFINMVMSRDRNDPNRFSLFEIWADREDFFEVQLKRPYHQRYHDRIDAIASGPRDSTERDQMLADYRFQF